MIASEAYEELLREIGSLLKERGFSRKGSCFYLRQGNNWGLLAFQKSRKTTANRVIFTINLGICSGRLTQFFSPELMTKRPSIETCHWRERLGFLLPEHGDKWWSVQAGEPYNSPIGELKANLDSTAIPALERHLSDAQLCSEWLSGRSPGLTDLQRLINLSVLLKASAEDTAFSMVLKELEGKLAANPSASRVKQYVQRLRGCD